MHNGARTKRSVARGRARITAPQRHAVQRSAKKNANQPCYTATCHATPHAKLHRAMPHHAAPVMRHDASQRHTDGHMAQVAVLHSWPYCTGGHIAAATLQI